ncbi:hypothetical protein [Archangium violaceum]|uniref:hypothetical protein n=1 Tax=Archangium violaceum TaxID=83451 RepID=UPI0036DCE4F6
MSHDYVDLARHNQTLVLGSVLQSLSQPGAARAEHFLTAAVCYRVLGVCVLLQDANVEGFAAHLAKAGQARLSLLEHASRAQLPRAPEDILASDNVGFSDALAAGDLKLARAIALLSPQLHATGLEYEEDFLFSRFLHLWTGEPRNEKDVRLLMERWEQIVDTGADLRLDVCQSLYTRNADRLADSIQALIEERKHELHAYRKQLDFDPEVAATTGKIYIDGLALLRLAEVEGIPSLPAYELLPTLARVPHSTPLPKEGSWRTA